MNTQPTPKLDVWEAYCDECYYHMWRLRRKTERGWYDGFHIHTGEEAKGLCETLNKLERELNEAREESIRWQSIAEGRGRTDDDEQLTAQRDGMEEKLRIELRGHPDSELWGDAGLIAATMRCVDALDVVTEQRDMLAEALRKVSRSWNYAEVAQQALQSLTHKP